jgi:hypothetical protein
MSISLLHVFTGAFTFRSLFICLSSPTLRLLLFCSSSIPRANTFPQNARRRLPRLRHSLPVVPARAASPPMTEDELVLNAQHAEDAAAEDVSGMARTEAAFWQRVYMPATHVPLRDGAQHAAERVRPEHAARAATRGSVWTYSGRLRWCVSGLRLFSFSGLIGVRSCHARSLRSRTHRRRSRAV